MVVVTTPIQRLDETLGLKVLQRNDPQYAKVQVRNQRSEPRVI